MGSYKLQKHTLGGIMKGEYYCAHLHMHSCFEGIASMEGHMYQAKQLGIDVIWFTDHDSRIGKKKDEVVHFDFEDEGLIEYNQATGASQGWKPIETEHSAVSEIGITNEKAYQGSRSMKMMAVADGTDGEWKTAGVMFFSTAHRHVVSLLARVSLKIACMVEALSDNDSRMIFDMKLSQRPPEHKHARLRYVIGNTEGLTEEHISVIPVSADIGRWQELEFNLSKDAEKYPVGGLDNVFDTISIVLQVRNEGKIQCYIDDFHIHYELAGEEARAEQSRVAKIIGQKYGIIPYVGTEISAAGQHKNCFCTNVPIIDYRAKNYNVSHDEAIDWVKRHEGIFSLNHPFEHWKNIEVNDEERKKVLDEIANKYIASKCDGASLIEIGFPVERAHFTLPYYLELWDRLSKNGIFITGYGDSDNHTNHINWWDGNNFTAWIYAEEPTEENLIRSMKSGNVYTGDPAVFKGQLIFKTSEGHVMGQVVRVRKSDYVLILELSEIMEGWTIQWVADGIRKDKMITDKGCCRSEFCLSIKEDIHFVRVELYDEKGRCILLTNPIYFVKGEHIEIPKERETIIE